MFGGHCLAQNNAVRMNGFAGIVLPVFAWLHTIVITCLPLSRDESGTVMWQYHVDDGVDGKAAGWCASPLEQQLLYSAANVICAGVL